MSRYLTEAEIAKLFMAAEQAKPNVVKVRFKPLEPVYTAKNSMRPIENLNDVKMSLKVQLGSTELTVREVLDLDVGSLIQLDRLAGEPADVYINDRYFATGEVVVINEVYGVRIHAMNEEETETE